MLNGAFALMERSLRIDARTWSPHLARVGLIFSIYACLCFTLSSQGKFGAPGLRFFEGIAYLDLVFMTLLGISFFSTAITEEKEEDTLGLMVMAGISPVGILAGKSVGRLWQALLLVAVQYPLMLLAVTMGGVSQLQITAVTVALMASMVFLAGFGLLCSTAAARNRTAGIYMTIGIAAYVLIPMTAMRIRRLFFSAISAANNQQSSYELASNVLTMIGDTCIYLKMNEILATGFQETPWSIQVISNGILGVACAALSWAIFASTSQSLSSEGSSRGFVFQKRTLWGPHAGRCWDNPFLWKDFYFVSGGFGMIIIRVAYYIGLGIALFGIEAVERNPSISVDSTFSSYCFLTSLSIVIDAANVLARSIHDEIRGQTLAAIMMMPRSSTLTLYSKFGGALLGWLPGPFFLLCGSLATQTGRLQLWNFVINKHSEEWSVMLFFFLTPHFAPLVATYVRWGAAPVSFAMTIGVYFVIGGFMMLFGIGHSTEFMAFLTLALLLLCVGCHIAVLLRVPYLSAK